MKSHPLLQRLSLAIALSLASVSMIALAAEPRNSSIATETTEVEIIANGVSEKISLEDMQVGETRQLYSEAGTLVTAHRTAESLELDIAGEKTSIRMIDPGAMDGPELAALIEAHGAGDGRRRVVHVHRDGKHAAGDAGDGHRKIVMISSGDGSVHDIDADDVHVLLDEADAGDGKRVIVKRKRVEGRDASGK